MLPPLLPDSSSACVQTPLQQRVADAVLITGIGLAAGPDDVRRSGVRYENVARQQVRLGLNALVEIASVDVVERLRGVAKKGMGDFMRHVAVPATWAVAIIDEDYAGAPDGEQGRRKGAHVQSDELLYGLGAVVGEG